MAESWKERLRREAREIDTAVGAALARPQDDKQLRDELEAAAQKPRFGEQTWRWGPIVYQRNRVLFRPFILSNFGELACDRDGKLFDPWRGPTAPALEAWLAAVDTADDVELTRRLYSWRLWHVSFLKREAQWRGELVRRFVAAASPSQRFSALAKLDTFMRLDVATARTLYETDRAASRKFILSHLPWFGPWSRAKPADWLPLLAISQADPDFHFEIYRRIVDKTRWRADVLELCKRVTDPAKLDRELELRHPRGTIDNVAEIFVELARARGRDIVPYLLRHLASVFPRWFFIQRQAKGLDSLLALANERGWLDLWGALLRTSATQQLFDAEVKRLAKSTLPDDQVRSRLALIAGHGAEANFPLMSFATVKPLDDATAAALYRRFPDLVRGPFRMHVASGYQHHYLELVRAALDAHDGELLDYIASRVALGVTTNKLIEPLTAHYEALPEREFVARAANALSRMPAYAIFNYDHLLRTNALARLLFERSTPLYLDDANAVRDLLESPQIHVQVLAFRILANADARAAAIGAASADLLQATLFRPLHTRTRLLAFRALERATSHDEATARYLLGRMREALALPEKRYPMEKLIGLIGRVLYRWPVLRSAREVPRIYSGALHPGGEVVA